MSVRLVIESAPHAQPVTERAFTGGRLVIGRGGDADWVLNDPDMYVSRQHCILTGQDGRVMVTDASSSGLFIDNAAHPVGVGQTVAIEPGMRLRMGDFVLRVEALSGALPSGDAVPDPAARGGMVFDFGFPAGAPPAPESDPRPADLPDPFGLSGNGRSHQRPPPVATPGPLDQDDAFGLDLRPGREQAAVSPSGALARGGGYFDSASAAAVPAPDARPAPAPSDIFADWRQPESPSAPIPPKQPAPHESPEPPLRSTGHDAHEALLRGMGLDPGQFTGDPVRQAEQIGRSVRILVEGLMQQLRARAQTKQKARVAQTIIASSDVNPLKFLATAEDVLASFLQPRGRGYLGAEDALDQAFRDLTDHQLRMWTALQTALRRMIDRFDPEEIEKAMAEVGLLESLIAGGRSARLWRLYQERYRDIARAAEDQFLGEVGADFRDAYESGRRKQDDGLD